MPARWRALFGGLLLVGLLPGASCGGESPRTEADGGRVVESEPVRCAVGERPDYFVPGDGRVALLGCARLGVSGRRVELSANMSRIDRDLHLCINPAYSGRGRRGFFIPGICKLDPPASRFAVRDAGRPRQGVRGYEFVVWGTADAATSRVTARFDGGTARAAVFAVRSKLSRDFGEAPFALFVAELPLAAACRPVTVQADGSAATERIPPRRELCEGA